MLASLTDRLDGFVARLVRGTSELGVQLDSFADFLNFGIAPAWLSFAFIEAKQQAFGYSDAYLWFSAACSMLWVIGAVFRLARYNIHSDEAVPTKIFFGVPTTLAGGLFAIWFLAFYKYAQPGPATDPRCGSGVGIAGVSAQSCYLAWQGKRRPWRMRPLFPCR